MQYETNKSIIIVMHEWMHKIQYDQKLVLLIDMEYD